MVEFVEAIKRPLKTDLITVVLGTVFMGMRVLGVLLTGFGVIVGGILAALSLLVHGLGVEASRRVMHKDHSMPHFDDYVDLFFTGLMVFVIGILYFLPAMIVMGMGIANSIPLILGMMGTALWDPTMAVQGLLLLVLRGAVYGLLTLILSLLALIMLPVAIQLYAKNKELGDAFNFGHILNVVATPSYWMSWAVLAGYGVLLVGIAIIISTLSALVLTIPAFGLAMYLWWMTFYTLFAETTMEASVGNTRRAAHKASGRSSSSKRGRFAHKR